MLSSLLAQQLRGLPLITVTEYLESQSMGRNALSFQRRYLQIV